MFVVFWRIRKCFVMYIGFVLRVVFVGSALRPFVAAEPLDALVAVFEHAPVSSQQPDTTAQAARAIIQRLASQPRNSSTRVGATIDPDLHHARAFCDKDFSRQCPLLFSPAGVGKCAPTPEYMGPCTSVSQSFESLSASAKDRWSELCVTSWPCVECRRDFSSLCPGGWVSDGGTKCKPSATYSGPCGAVVNFAGFTRNMMSDWSSICGAHWPCVS